MKCIFCKEPSGFLKSYHQECFDVVQGVLSDLEGVVNQYNQEILSKAETKNRLLEISTSSKLYSNYLNYELGDLNIPKEDDNVIYLEKGLLLFESKNRCRMVRTGYRYEKMPDWNEEKILLNKNATIVFTDKRIFLIESENEISYNYNQIVNIGFDEKLGYAYFEVKTRSKYPHRFSLKPYNKKEINKIHNICLFLHCLV